MSCFCPTCGTLLVLVGGTAEPMQFRCEACEYAYELDQQLRNPARLDRKVIDDIISLEDVMKNAPQTKVSCPKCPADSAYFYELQIRSADEPATIFYQCTGCGHNWREQ